MRILALTDYQSDYLAHSVLTGLHESGHEVWELPVLNSIRGGTDEGYDLPDGNRGMTATPGYLDINPICPYDKHEVTAEIVNGCDLIVMLSGRDYARRALKVICAMTNKEPKDLPIALCDGEDFDDIDVNLLNLVQPKVFFKRELLNQYSIGAYSGHYGVPIFPLPFAAFVRSTHLPHLGIDDSIKDRDFYLSLGDTHALRREIVVRLLDERDRNEEFRKLTTWIACNSEDGRIKGREDGMKAWKNYIAMQAHARSTLVVRGYGHDTLHCWEAFSFATLVVYIEPKIYIPYPFNENHCVKVPEANIDNIPNLIRVINDPQHHNLAATLAQSGKKHCLEYHTTKARAEYLIDVASRVIGGQKVHYDEFGL